MPISRATLTLVCTNASDDGGTVYPVADSSWIEGDRNGADSGSANGPGLKWTDVDTNGDGTIDDLDASPYRPVLTRCRSAGFGAVAAGQAYTVDVTPALSEHRGSGFARAHQRQLRRRRLRLAPGDDREPASGAAARAGRGSVADADRDVRRATVTSAATPPRSTPTPAPRRRRAPQPRPATADGNADAHPHRDPDAPRRRRSADHDAAIVLAPVADTYIEAARQATWDHGAATVLEVDASPPTSPTSSSTSRAVHGADRLGAADALLHQRVDRRRHDLSRSRARAGSRATGPGPARAAPAGRASSGSRSTPTATARSTASTPRRTCRRSRSPIVGARHRRRRSARHRRRHVGVPGCAPDSSRWRSRAPAPTARRTRRRENATASQRPVLRLVVGDGAEPDPCQHRLTAGTPRPDPSGRTTTPSPDRDATPTARPPRPAHATAPPPPARPTRHWRSADPVGIVDLAPVADTYIEAGTERDVGPRPLGPPRRRPRRRSGSRTSRST